MSISRYFDLNSNFFPKVVFDVICNNNCISHGTNKLNSKIKNPGFSLVAIIYYYGTMFFAVGSVELPSTLSILAPSDWQRQEKANPN